jgi:hypothetical protein
MNPIFDILNATFLPPSPRPVELTELFASLAIILSQHLDHRLAIQVVIDELTGSLWANGLLFSLWGIDSPDVRVLGKDPLPSVIPGYDLP